MWVRRGQQEVDMILSTCQQGMKLVDLAEWGMINQWAIEGMMDGEGLFSGRETEMQMNWLESSNFGIL